MAAGRQRRTNNLLQKSRRVTLLTRRARSSIASVAIDSRVADRATREERTNTMNINRWLGVALLGAAAISGVGNAWADRGRVHIGVTVGPYWADPWYYPAPYPYYYPRYSAPIVVEQAAPQMYVSPQPAPEIAAPTNYWYYCAATKSYYPYVRECPAGWQKVLPQPPDQP
jgi:hypothetical protein